MADSEQPGKQKTASSLTKERYDRIAPRYDLFEAPIERLAFSGWRRRLWDRVRGSSVLELGVGTGKNLPYHPAQARVIAVDFSEQMLKRAHTQAKHLDNATDLALMDVEHLAFPDNSFDTVMASFVFCSVADPVQGFSEVRRVCRAGGQILLLEHVRGRPPLGWLMDIANPVAVRMGGENINRQTVENMRQAGLEPVQVDNLFLGVFKLIEARPQDQGDINHRTE